MENDIISSIFMNQNPNHKNLNQFSESVNSIFSYESAILRNVALSTRFPKYYAMFILYQVSFICI